MNAFKELFEKYKEAFSSQLAGRTRAHTIFGGGKRARNSSAS